MQTLNAIAIRYEMIDETRIIPLRWLPHAGARLYLSTGDARAARGRHAHRRDDELHQSHALRLQRPYNSEKLKLVERFTPIGPGKLNWE